MLDTDKAPIERVLRIRNEQRATTPTHRYLDTADKRNRFRFEGLKSPISAVPRTES
ncbi:MULTISPECIES: hypothetical protein [Burkholderia]|uniref:Uncharacterized protein n=1 Tax=Burkholderia multivorans (strain ATCC 17616 / 249) TaxID=395019 RepID=A0A0H3KQN1_BURM1|nr:MULTISPECIES: hypothetical protein [Burkholderia]AIO71628.1 hypothetical protein DM80_6053 [Burkholderia multivorans]MBR7913774.1 hypothetical protein [Burkholderia vietnamiensis]MBU9146369.1 hypothetical protein [Burkholderia multivorans]MBU9540477.1 hypothetical protein [Burkholderia multivorans]MBU9639507.1 hypothetical protein [Burkholderia multivorans]